VGSFSRKYTPLEYYEKINLSRGAITVLARPPATAPAVKLVKIFSALVNSYLTGGGPLLSLGGPDVIFRAPRGVSGGPTRLEEVMFRAG